jgi:hypothetical protein
MDDAQKPSGDPHGRGIAKRDVDGLQGHKNAAGERAIEGTGSGSSEAEWPIGKQS